MTDFDDGKDEGALRTIGEVSEGLGIKPHVLRYWEQQFSALKPLKRSGGRRYYRPDDVDLVETINRLVNEEGYTLKGADAALRASNRGESDRRAADRRSGDRRIDSDDSAAAARSPATLPDRDFGEALAQLKSIRKRLAKAIDA
ncbi:MAG: MerR family transcriptional regulator [Erythrobacter sp.]